MVSLESLLAYVSLALSGLALAIMVLNRIERRLAQIIAQENGALTRDMATLLGEVRTLVEVTRAGLTAPPAPQPLPAETPKADEVSAQLREVCGQLRELRRQMAERPLPAAPVAPVVEAPAPVVAAPAAPPPTPVAPAPVVASMPAPEPVVAMPTPAMTPPPAQPAPPVAEPPPALAGPQPVPARLLDAVLTDNLGAGLMYLHEHGGMAGSEQEIPGTSQVVAKLLSLRLARADERGIYLTETGNDIANLLLSVSR